MKLRNYQQELVDLALSKKNLSLNLLIQADTGSGKTAVLAEIIRRSPQVLCIAHRNILIKQLSSTLAKFNIKHRILATTHTKRQCVLAHRLLEKDMINGSASKHVCSIDSLLSRHRRGRLLLDTSAPWLIVVDEAHHMVSKNKWGKLLEIFPNARLIGATATPCRLDQKSLSSKKDGCFDELIQASELKENSLKTLIDMGYISPFKCYSLPNHISTSGLTKYDGDYTYKSLCTETNKVKYEMAGDAVKYYKKLAFNKQALVFCVSIELAKETAEYFKDNGVHSAAIHSGLSSVEVTRIFDLFQKKQIKVLCNVDMIGEGVDIPAIEALIMLRKTASFGLYRQWIGRSLRPESGKEHAIILDHVANIRTHDLPDKHIDWSLDNPPNARKSNLKPCPECRFLNMAWDAKCEECGTIFVSEDAQSTNQNDLKYIDIGLVEIHRRNADEKKKRAQKKWEYDNIINEYSLNRLSQTGFMGKLATKLRKLSVEHLTDSVSIARINDYLVATEAQEFWISQFSNSDINKNNPVKFIKVYRRWLKLN